MGETPASETRRDISPAKLLRRLEMPLLLVELKDLAWRKRTYVVRFLYAFALFTVACSLFYGNLTQGQTDSLGRGRQIFVQFLQIQFWVIALFLPATTAGVITVEKERNALGVLMLTTLGPLRIVLQKLLSRLLPMYSFLLLAMPLMAVGGLPVGVQFMGQQGEDARMTGFARWALASISPVCVE